MLVKKGTPLGNAEIIKDSMSTAPGTGRGRDLLCAQLGDSAGAGVPFLLSRAQFLPFAIN